MMPRRLSILTSIGFAAAVFLATTLFGFSQRVSLAQGGENDTATNQAEASRALSRATKLHNAEEYALAIPQWQSFLKKYPDHARAADARFYLGYCFYRTKKNDEAAAALRKLLEDHPKYRDAERARMHLAIALYDRAVLAAKPQGYAAAATAYDTFLKKHPKSKHAADALFGLAESYFAMEQHQKAAQAYARLVRDYPKFNRRAEAQLYLGEAHLIAGKNKEAQAALESFLEEHPQDKQLPLAMMYLGEALLNQNKLEQAEPLLRRAAAAEGFAQADEAKKLIGDLQTAKGEFLFAAETYVAAIEQHPNSKLKTVLQLLAGRAYFHADKLDEAIKYLTPITQVKTTVTFEAGHWLARTYLKKKQPQKALEAAGSVMFFATSDWKFELRIDQADAIFQMPQRQKEAVAMYAKIAVDFPQHARAGEALYFAAWSAFQLKDYETALKHAEAFSASYADTKSVQQVVAACGTVAADSLLNLDRYALAAARYSELIDKHAADKSAKSYVDGWRLSRGWAHYLQGDYPAAIKTLQGDLPRLSAGAKQGEAQYAIASALAAQKKFSEVIPPVNAAIDALKEGDLYEQALLLLARANRQTGDLENAEVTARRLIKESPQSKHLDRARLRLAEILYDTERFADAAAQYKIVVDTWPKAKVADDAWYGLGWSNLRQNQHAQAEQAFSKLFDGYPDSPLRNRALLDRARARRLAAATMADQKPAKLAEALADVEAFLKTDPKKAARSDALFQLGLIQLERGKNAAAAEAMQTLLDENPEFASADEARYQLGWAHKLQKRGADARNAFASIAEKHPDSDYAAEGLYHVGEHHYEKKEYVEALKQYDASLAKASQTKVPAVRQLALLKRGWSLYLLKRYDESEKAFARLLIDFPASEHLPVARFMLAESQFHLHQFDKARTNYEKVLDNLPRLAQHRVLTMLHLGESYGKANEWKKKRSGTAPLSE